MDCSVGERSDGRCDIEVALAVFARVPHIRWQRCAPPLMAAFVLACAAVAPAAGPQPNVDPLWQAYPLDTDSPAPATTTSPAAPVVTQRPATSPAPLDRSQAGGPPRAITLLFFGSLAGAVLLLGVALIAEGWEPYGRGRAWWEMRLRRTPESSGTPREAIHG
jgi:hypothetical protein